MSHLSHPVQQAQLVAKGDSSRLQVPAWGRIFRRFICLLPFLTSTLNFPWSRHNLMYPYPDMQQHERREGAARSDLNDGAT